MRRLPVCELATADIDLEATVVLPPAKRLKPDRETRARLSVIDVLEKIGS